MKTEDDYVIISVAACRAAMATSGGRQSEIQCCSSSLAGGLGAWGVREDKGEAAGTLEQVFPRRGPVVVAPSPCQRLGAALSCSSARHCPVRGQRALCALLAVPLRSC